MTSATAPGKVILLGEHAVVYDRPALAAPLNDLTVTASVADHSTNDLLIHSPDMNHKVWLSVADPEDPLAKAAHLTLDSLAIKDPPEVRISIKSNLPIAAGLGSGAAVSIAIVRALSKHLGNPLGPKEQSAIAYEVEKLHHGTPSGIDNTVIAHESPVYYIKGKTIETLAVGRPLPLLIADTGIPSPTSVAVAGVRQRRHNDEAHIEAVFDHITELVKLARAAIASGNLESLGETMDQNHKLLVELGVSCHELEELVQIARESGALGAKLSGGGLGGNMIALFPPDKISRAKVSLESAGTSRVLQTLVG